MKRLKASCLCACLACAWPAVAQFPAGLRLEPVFDTDGANKLDTGSILRAMPGKPGWFLAADMRSGELFLFAPEASGPGYRRSLFGVIDVFTRSREPFMGLQGLAFHPRFAENRKYYVKYGRPDQVPARETWLDEREASADFLKDSNKPPRRILVMDNEGSGTAHTGGPSVFGPDGFLYMSYGDMGRRANGQNLENLMAKMIRIDVDRKDPGLEYAIPKDNPFVAHSNPRVRREIFAYGLRTTYRFSFDRLTGELYGADIGEKQYDEVNIVEKGGNYGWALKEGGYCYGGCEGVAIKEPLAQLRIPPGSFMCFIGGHVYRGDPASPFYGAYIFADWDQRKIYALKKGGRPGRQDSIHTLLSTGPAHRPIDMEMDAQGNLFVLTYMGAIFRLAHPDLRPVAVRERERAPESRRRVRLIPAGLWRSRAAAGEEMFSLGGRRLARPPREGLVLIRRPFERELHLGP